MRGKPTLALASVLLAALAAVSMPAQAACKKFGFTVNDYGKDGPTNDAKNLLDKHIAEWAAQNGVTAYQTGKKNVSCELFLDVILFDEHTCTASASVCWGEGVKPNNKAGAQSAQSTPAAAAGTPATTEEASGEAPPAPVRKAEALGIAPQQAAAAPTAPVTEAAPAAESTAAAESAVPVEQVTAPAEMPAVETAAPADGPPVPLTTSGAAVETGALQAGAGLATVPSASSHAAPTSNHVDRAAAAQAAATAAAAAERAAVAAETAASAAKEAAAAAVAASAASKSTTATATVPPLGQAATHAE